MFARYALLFHIIISSTIAYAEDKPPELPDFLLYGDKSAPKAAETAQKTEKSIKSSSQDVDVKTQAIPAYVLDMLNSQNGDINALASNQAEKQLEKQKLDAQKQMQLDEQQKKITEAEKLKQEAARKEQEKEEEEKQVAKLEEEYRQFYHRPQYDKRTMQMEDQIHKKEYGPNNQHLSGFLSSDDYSSYLFLAVIQEDISSINGLLAKGANINARDAKNGYTPLMYAIKNKKNTSVDCLASKGADFKLQASDGSTALHIAMRHKNIDAIKSLLYLKAPVDISDKHGKHPILLYPNLPDSIAILAFDLYGDKSQALLDFAAIGNFNLMQKAIKSGAKVNIQNKDGYTPLMLVLKHNNPQLVALLLQEKPDITLVNRQGLNAVTLAGIEGGEYIWSIVKTYEDEANLRASVTPITSHHSPYHQRKHGASLKATQPNKIKVSPAKTTIKPLSLIPSDKK